MSEVSVAISSDFLKSYAQLPKSAQKGVWELIPKFKENPRAPSINYEKINTPKDRNYRSVRVSRGYRGIIRKPDTGNIFLFLWVDKHDHAYDWALRHSVRINDHTKELQVVDTSIITEPLPSSSSTYSQAEYVADKPIINLSDKQLLQLGVPSEKLELVKSIKTEDDLEYAEGRLPIGAYEAVYMAAAGTVWEDLKADYITPLMPTTPVLANTPTLRKETIEYSDKPSAGQAKDQTNELETALSSPESQRSFYLIEDDSDLKKILDAPLEHWRIFLHPSQNRLINRHWNGPVRVLGGAGTGKTVTAIHRAVWLVRNSLEPDSNEKILFTTFTSNLALDIEHNLSKICSQDELQRIEVKHIDRWIQEFLATRNYQNKIVYPGTEGNYDKYWAESLKQSDQKLEQSESFYTEEWERVILPQRILTKQEYFRANRAGRGVALSRAQRAEIWPIFERMRHLLSENQSCTYEDATHDAIDMLQATPLESTYRSVVIDEAQDMGSEALSLIRNLTPADEDDLFLVGDGHQRIYRRRAVMSQCGIHIVGRSHKLKINYRTTEEIRRFAVSVLEDASIDDLDGEADNSKQYYSLTKGLKPIITTLDSLDAEANHISTQIESLQRNGVDLPDICIVTRTKYLRSELSKKITRNGIATHMLEQANDDREITGIRMATIHRVKGLEFRYMFIASANEGFLPLTTTVKSTEDIVEARALDVNERALLHVAATRAISGLFISTSGPKSHYLDNYS